jgi:hypothetical protein
MDARRIAYVQRLCVEAGVVATATPILLYALVVGLETLNQDDPTSVMQAAFHLMK